MLNTALGQGCNRTLGIGMIEPVPLPGGLFSPLAIALANKHGYIYELSPPPYWSPPPWANVCLINFYGGSTKDWGGF